MFCTLPLWGRAHGAGRVGQDDVVVLGGVVTGAVAPQDGVVVAGGEPGAGPGAEEDVGATGGEGRAAAHAQGEVADVDGADVAPHRYCTCTRTCLLCLLWVQ